MIAKRHNTVRNPLHTGPVCRENKAHVIKLRRDSEYKSGILYSVHFLAFRVALRFDPDLRLELPITDLPHLRQFWIP